jgi:hypothetical protein
MDTVTMQLKNDASFGRFMAPKVCRRLHATGTRHEARVTGGRIVN